MRVRLVRKLAERIDGIDLSNYKIGDVLELPARKARLLFAEGWASRAGSDAAAVPHTVRARRLFRGPPGGSLACFPQHDAADKPGRKREQ
jgi:hypothetical protein